MAMQMSALLVVRRDHESRASKTIFQTQRCADQLGSVDMFGIAPVSAAVGSLTSHRRGLVLRGSGGPRVCGEAGPHSHCNIQTTKSILSRHTEHRTGSMCSQPQYTYRWASLREVGGTRIAGRGGAPRRITTQTTGVVVVDMLGTYVDASVDDKNCFFWQIKQYHDEIHAAHSPRRATL